jgi:hypothetical protein
MYKFKPKPETLARRQARLRRIAKSNDDLLKAAGDLPPCPASIVIDAQVQEAVHTTNPADDENVSEWYKTQLALASQIESLATDVREIRNIQDSIIRNMPELKMMAKTISSMEAIFAAIHVKLRALQGVASTPKDIISML